MTTIRKSLVLSVAGFLFAAAPILAEPPDIKSVPNTVVDLPMTGTVTSTKLDKNIVTVKDDFGKTADVNITENMQILRDGETVQATSLKPGDHVTVMNRTK